MTDTRKQPIAYLQIRASYKSHHAIKRAAKAAGQTMQAFMLEAVETAAVEELESHGGKRDAARVAVSPSTQGIGPGHPLYQPNRDKP